MRNKRVLRSQTHSTAATGKELLLLWLFPFKSRRLSLLTEIWDCFCEETSLAVTDKVVWESLTKGNSLEGEGRLLCQGLSYVLWFATCFHSAAGPVRIMAFVLDVWSKWSSIVSCLFQYWSEVIVLIQSLESGIKAPYTPAAFQSLFCDHRAETAALVQPVSFTICQIRASVDNTNLHRYWHTSCLCIIHIFIITLENGYSWIAELR